jgi:hypothetical protein
VTDLIIIVPSRGRPHAAAELIEAFGETRTTAQLVFALDEDDPTRDEYAKVVPPATATIDTGGAPATMVRALNAAAMHRAASENPPFAVGFMGDDHRPRTPGWDAVYLEALRELGTGIVYGNDLLQGERIPTQVAMTSDIVRSLGWMAPPVLTHLYVDNFWKDLGVQAGCLRYLADVVVEHLHPVAGKAAWDEGHVRVNAPEMYHADRAAYARFIEVGGLTAAVETVRSLRGAA